MPITLSCPSCNKRLEAPDKYARRPVKCPKCQTVITVPAAVPPSQPVPPPPVPVAVNSTTVAAKSFCCNGCGTPLKIPKNSRGHVQCPSCRNDCVLEGLVKNAEIAAKENIQSGVSLNAAPASLHRQLVSALSESSSIPLDVFEKIGVVREERYCVPAYIFYCNATASFSYETARDQIVTDGESDKRYAGSRKVTLWDAQQGTVSTSSTILAPGVKALAEPIMKLYSNFDFKRLMDVEELEFPPDTDTHKFNLTLPVAFNEYVQPLVEKRLEEKAVSSLSNKRTCNLSMGGSNIQKETVRAFLGLYRVVYMYGGQEYSIWVSGDGKNAFYEGVPKDTQRQETLDGKRQFMQQSVAVIPEPNTGGLTIGMWACIVGAFFTMGLSLIGAVVCGVMLFKKKKEYDTQCEHVRAKFQMEIDAFEEQAKNVVQRFQAQKRALRGIYAGVSGDAEAF